MAGTACEECLGDKGYQEGEGIRKSGVETAALIRQIAAAAIAIDNANRLVDNYKALRDISDRSLKIAEKQQQQLKDVYWPRELEFLQEFGTPEAIEEIEVMGKRYAGRLVAAVAAAFAKELRKLRCNASRYCTSAYSKSFQDLIQTRSTAIAGARVLGRNIGFAEFQARTDTNFERRMQAIALGRGLMNEAAKLLTKASGSLASATAQTASQLSSALEAFSYARNRSTATTPAAVSRSNAGQTPAASSQADPLSQAQHPGVNTNSDPFAHYVPKFYEPPPDPQFNVSTGAEWSSPNAWWSEDQYRNSTFDQLSEAKVGNQNLIRTGAITYTVPSYPDSIVFTIDMAHYGTQYADNLDELNAAGGDAGNATAAVTKPKSDPLVNSGTA